MTNNWWIVLLLSALSASVFAQEDWPELSGPLLGQAAPGVEPVVFAPGLVSTADSRELNAVFSPDMNTFMFTREIDGVFKMHVSHRDSNGLWTPPRIASASLTYPGHADVDMAFAPGGRRLYFISKRPLAGHPLDAYNIWYSDRTAQGLLPPVALGPEINTLENQYYPVIVGDGSLYFATRRADSLGQFDNYRAQFSDGRFDRPVNLGPAINSEFSEGDIFVDAKESYLIHVSSGRPDSLGRGDLYISFKQPDGSWSKDRHMGDEINSADIDYCPMVTPDGKYFFFTRGNDVYWVDASVIEQFRP